MRVEGGTMPWDKALTATMRKLQGEYKRVRSATGRGKLARRFGDEGEEAFDRTLTAWSREPKLRLSDWLFESGNGIRMRRDFTANKEAIREMLQAGVRFSDAVSWAETVHAAR
jgi:hypothetical protein